MFPFGPVAGIAGGVILVEEALNGVAHRSQNNTNHNESVESGIPVEANDRMRSFLLGTTNWLLGAGAGYLSLNSYRTGNIPLAIDAGQAMMTFVLPGTIRVAHGIFSGMHEQPKDLSGVAQLGRALTSGKFIQALTGTYR